MPILEEKQTSAGDVGFGYKGFLAYSTESRGTELAAQNAMPASKRIVQKL